jgi:transposase InsO family protein|tara:strand:+ start:192 stop:1112 length:921 start_codon:yes stop_codon:yes gene_type:complete
MPKNIKEERLRWILPIFNKEIKLVDAVKVCPHSKRSLERWLSAYKKHGEVGIEPKSTRPKTNPNETPIRIKERVIELRKDTKKCAKKISWDLEDEGIKLHYQTVQKIIKNEGLTKKYRIRKIKYKYVRALLRVGELVEIDIKYVPKTLNGRKYYQYTAIDCATRWRFMKVYDSPSNQNSIKFLEELIKVAPFHIEAIKTDNDVCFTNRYVGYLKSSDPLDPRLHPFDLLCLELGITHYLIDPGKPSQNGKVERSHREDQEKFYDMIPFNSFSELQYKIRLWNMYYNDLKHCSLNKKTPNQMVEELT